MTQLPILFSRTNKEKIQQWLVRVEGDKYQTEFGQVGGKIENDQLDGLQPNKRRTIK